MLLMNTAVLGVGFLFVIIMLIFFSFHHISGVMVFILTPCTVECGLPHVQYNVGFPMYSRMWASATDWLARNEDNETEWSHMSTTTVVSMS